MFRFWQERFIFLHKVLFCNFCCCTKFCFGRLSSTSRLPMSTQNWVRSDKDNFVSYRCWSFSPRFRKKFKTMATQEMWWLWQRWELSNQPACYCCGPNKHPTCQPYNQPFSIWSILFQGYGRRSCRLIDRPTDWKKAKHIHIHKGDAKSSS